VYVTAICYIGSKSLSHVLSCIERCKERLLALGPVSEAARQQVITSVMDYWKDQPGIGVNIVDKLLNYTILTPMSVVEWALVSHSRRGASLADPAVYEMVSSTVYKVTNRIRQIVIAKNSVSLPAEQKTLLEETLLSERAGMRELFKVLEEALVGWASGSKDEAVEVADTGDSVDEKLVRGWGERWLRVFRRKFAVEESFINAAGKESASDDEKMIVS
jgi:nuclear cap-binding protein subunit 1